MLDMFKTVMNKAFGGKVTNPFAVLRPRLEDLSQAAWSVSHIMYRYVNGRNEQARSSSISAKRNAFEEISARIMGMQEMLNEVDALFSDKYSAREEQIEKFIVKGGYNYVKNGLIPMVIRTIGTHEEFVFKPIPDPENLKKTAIEELEKLSAEIDKRMPDSQPMFPL